MRLYERSVADIVLGFKTLEQSSDSQRPRYRQKSFGKFGAQKRQMTAFGGRVPDNFNHWPHINDIMQSCTRHASFLAERGAANGWSGNAEYISISTPCHLVSHFYSHIFLASAYQVRRDVTGNENIARTGRHDPPVSAECRLSIKPRTNLINSSL